MLPFLSIVGCLVAVHAAESAASAELLANTSADASLLEPRLDALSRSVASSPSPFETNADSCFSYTYLQAGYYSTDVDAYDESSDAVYARVSLGLFEVLHVFGEYSAETLKDAKVGAGSGDVDNDTFALGAGLHFSLSPRFDVVGEAAWVYDDLSSDDFSNLDDTNSGVMAFVGGRWMAVPWAGGGLELDGGYRWHDREALFSDDRIGAWEAGLRVHVLEFLSVGATATFLEDDDRIGLDARISF
ncbi:MAG: porin family protein [Planctomycetes bacterium]|nr:porin family protein [Planctomycetota bacterium]